MSTFLLIYFKKFCHTQEAILGLTTTKDETRIVYTESGREQKQCIHYTEVLCNIAAVINGSPSPVFICTAEVSELAKEPSYID
jgi:hypothetical protein